METTPVPAAAYDVAQVLLMVSYALLGFAVVAVFIMWIVNGIKDVKPFLFSIAAFVGFVVIFGIAYLSSDPFTNETVVKFGVSPEATRAVGAAMKVMYLLTAVALLGIVVNTVTGIIKRA